MASREPSAAPDPASAKDRCWHQSEPSDQGVFRCTRPKGHEGEHRSTRASWYSDPPSHESVAASYEPTMIEARLHAEYDALGLISYHGAPWDHGNTTYYADLTKDDIEKLRELLHTAGMAVVRLVEAVRQGHVFVTDALDELYESENEAVESDGTVGVRLISARDALMAVQRVA